jgi:hypothetical protein
MYVGIDNGVTGSIGIVDEFGNLETFIPMPVFKEQDYTKKKAMVTRIQTGTLCDILSVIDLESARVILERPMVNPTRFVATKSALRALEATLVVLERLCMPYQFIDSKVWQKALLPQGCQKEELKKASRDIGTRLFPDAKDIINALGDADGLLIAEYARRNRL